MLWLDHDEELGGPEIVISCSEETVSYFQQEFILIWTAFEAEL